MQTYNSVMVDVETSGLDMDHAGIIQLSAVKFDLATRTVNSDNMFDFCLHLLPGRYWDEGTRDWWYGRNRAVLDTILPRRVLPEPVFRRFNDWAFEDIDTTKQVHFWGKPTHFDFAIIDSHFKQIGLRMPFHFRAAIDMNSYIRGMAGDVDAELNFYEPDAEMAAQKHNGLIDCLWQIQNLFVAEDHYRGRTKED